MKRCALCQKESELKRSHIIPEFLYKAMYDDKHSFHVLSSVPELPDSMVQKGLRELLLCGDCETHISCFERYARGVLSGGVPLDYKKEGRVVQVARDIDRHTTQHQRTPRDKWMDIITEANTHRTFHA